MRHAEDDWIWQAITSGSATSGNKKLTFKIYYFEEN